MAATINYPEGLPPPLRSGYGINHVSPLQRTELATGRAIQRRRYTSVPSIVAVSWNFSQSQAQVFEGWFRWTLSDGAEWFNARLRTPLGLQGYECRFVDIYEGPDLVGIDRWQFSAELEIRERQTVDAGLSAHPDLLLGAAIIDIAINREWPEA